MMHKRMTLMIILIGVIAIVLVVSLVAVWYTSDEQQMKRLAAECEQSKTVLAKVANPACVKYWKLTKDTIEESF